MSERCLKVWENVWDGLRDLKSADRRSVLEAIFAYAFDGAEPKLTGVSAAIFKTVRPLLSVYGSGKAFSGSLGGSVCGEAKSTAKIGNQNAKRDTSKTQAKHKQSTSKTQALLNENKNGNIPPISPKGGVPPSVIDDPASAGFPDRAKAPITREACVALAGDTMMSVKVSEDFAGAWWDEHDHDGWIDDDGRAIRGMRRVRQLLAGAFNYQKNKSARAVSPVGGAADVFDPARCE